MAGVFERYAYYWTDGAFQGAYLSERPFTVAVITTAGQRRIDHLKGLVQRSPVPIRLTTFDAVRQHGVLGPVWQSLGGEQCHGLWDDSGGLT